jgi:hypothetical protein
VGPSLLLAPTIISRPARLGTIAAMPGTSTTTSTMLAVAAAALASALPASFEADVRATLQPILDTTAELYNVSLSVGIATADQPFGFGLAAGYSNPGATTPVLVTNQSRFPVGSATKVGGEVVAGAAGAVQVVGCSWWRWWPCCCCRRCWW